MSLSRNYHGKDRYSSSDMQSLIERSNSSHCGSNVKTNHFQRQLANPVYNARNNVEIVPSSKRRKFSASTWGDSVGYYHQQHSTENAPSRSTSLFSASAGPEESSCITGSKRDRETFEDEVIFMSRDQIESLSPSRKDGIDSLRETYLRYSYCAFLQNLGMRLELPQTTIGTAMILCHRFFVRRSHACHDRFTKAQMHEQLYIKKFVNKNYICGVSKLIATAALFLTAKSEETARPLNDVLRASCEICHKQGLNFFPNLLPVDWFEQYRERVTDAEHMILTTLNFELGVQHPYDSVTAVLSKLGPSQTVLVNLTLCLVSEGLRSSLWLQFKPHHIAAGAAYLAAKFLSFDLASHQRIWQEFQTTPSILQDVVKQLMELF